MFATDTSISSKRPWQLIGQDVITPNGELLGVIKDVVLDKATDRVQQVVVSRLGDTGDGAGFLRISGYDLEFSEDDQAYVAPPQVNNRRDKHPTVVPGARAGF